jgi:hypothetical protein
MRVYQRLNAATISLGEAGEVVDPVLIEGQPIATTQNAETMTPGTIINMGL